MARQEKKENLQQNKKPRRSKKAKQPEPVENIETTSLEAEHTRHEIQGILYGAITLFLFVSLLTYHADDPATLSGPGMTQNITGVIGAIIADFFFRFFGYIAYIFPFIPLLLCIDKFSKAPRFVNYGNLLGLFVAILCLCALLSLPALGTETKFSPGGFIGITAAAFLISYFNLFGSLLVLITGLVTAGILFRKYLFHHLRLPGDLLIQEPPLVQEQRLPQILNIQEAPKNPEQPKKPKKRRKSLREHLPGRTPKKSAKSPSPQPKIAETTGYHLPSSTLLNKPQSEKIRANMKQNLLQNSKILEEKLADFGIEGQVVGVLPGPVITRYEFQPAPGIKVSRIVNLSDDLALGMKAVSIRIVAPVPGKDVVGIELPNARRETVYLRDLIESERFLQHQSRLVLAMGKDISGHPYFADLGKMPHMLIAGATGSGKSVCLNALICSILFHATPDEVRFIMVDPKMLELGVYDAIPHLLIPVVKDPQRASNALNWATEEMTRRYGTLAKKGVRNIAQYNEAMVELQKRQPPNSSQPVEKPLPYIVIIVDELADLKMVATGIEKPITRLAQMARAVGIHLILATQRPSVDVITGVIKANFPARISFRVSSKVDSRTILDANGAELLLGDGDMLFLLPGTSRIRRLHGAFLSEKEIKRLTTALKKMGKPNYDQSVLSYNTEGNSETEDEAAIYRKAAYLVVKTGEASISLLRRSLRIGHSRAARLIDTMEKDGIVGKFNGSRPREIVMTQAQLDQRFRNEE